MKIFRLKLALFLIYFILFLPAVVKAQVIEKWVARYDGPDGYDDVPNAIAVDNSLNVYVTGTCRPYTRGSQNTDICTIKYDADGNKLWNKVIGAGDFDRHSAEAMAVDDDGSVYVTGYHARLVFDDDRRRFIPSGDSNYFTTKYDRNGTKRWTKTFGKYSRNVDTSDGIHNDKASAIAVDHSGNVYVTGKSTSATDSDDYSYATIKYDSNGNELWVAWYSGVTHNSAKAIAVDDAGNVYVTGDSSRDGTSTDYATVKYDSNGNELWVAWYDYENSRDNVVGLVVDDTGNVYVTGNSNRAGTYWDYATIKYDSNGNELWVARYDGKNGGDHVVGLVVDDAGNVYVTGDSWTMTSEDVSNSDYATVKYDSNGNELWVARYDSPVNVNGNDYAAGLVLDNAGNVYVTGTSSKFNSYYDYATVKYDSYGYELWVERYSDEIQNFARAIAADDAGNVYVAGRTSAYASDTDYVTIKYSSVSGGDINGGDINEDGNITPQDALMAFQHYLGIFTLSEFRQSRAEVTGDGSITPADALCIFQRYLGLPSCLGN